MTVINITSNTNVSGLTPAGGNPADDYYVSSSAILTLDQSFTFSTLTLGKNSSGVATPGFLACRAGFTCTSNLGGPEAADITIWGGGEVKDAAVTPTTSDSPVTFKDASINPNPVILLREAGAKWSVQYYILVKPQIIFQIYEDLYPTETQTTIYMGSRVDVVQFSEDEGGVRYDLQDRFGKRPRYFRTGEAGRNVLAEISFNVEALQEAGLWQKFLRSKSQGFKGSMITDRRVWTNMRVVEVGPIKRAWGQDTTSANAPVRIVEDV
jgi:hypothetical protein